MRHVVAGTDVTFSVIAGGAGLFTYQWRKGTNNLSDGGNVSGATNAALLLTALTPADAGSYSVVVNGPAGTFTGPDAALFVLIPPAIVVPPASQIVVRLHLRHPWLLGSGVVCVFLRLIPHSALCIPPSAFPTSASISVHQRFSSLRLLRLGVFALKNPRPSASSAEELFAIYFTFRLTGCGLQCSNSIVTYIACRWQVTGKNRADRGRGSR